MPSPTDTDTMYPAAQNLMAGFNRHGLPGVVIGAQFLVIAALLYFLINAFQANTKAMIEMVGALNRLTENIKDQDQHQIERYQNNILRGQQ